MERDWGHTPGAESVADIAARWADIEAHVPGLAEDARARVATWRYWSGWSDAGPYEPLAEERHGWPPKDYEERRPPGPARRVTTCGYDADDRIVLTETGGYDRELEVFTYAGDHAESYQFDLGSWPGDFYHREPALAAVRRWWWSDGLLRARVTYRRRKPSADIRWRSETFEYDGDGRLRAVRDEPNTRITRVHWTDAGTLTRSLRRLRTPRHSRSTRIRETTRLRSSSDTQRSWPTTSRPGRATRGRTIRSSVSCW